NHRHGVHVQERRAGAAGQLLTWHWQCGRRGFILVAADLIHFRNPTMKHILKLGALAVAATLACASTATGAAPAAKAAASATTQPAAQNEAGKKLNALANEYWDALARFDPVSAGEAGDNRFYDQI